MIKGGKMSKIQNFLKELFKKIEPNLDKWDDFYKKHFGPKPNGFLEDIPLFVISTNYSQDNEVTGYKSYLKENFNENMFVNPYTLQVEALLYGRKFIRDLERIIEFSKERKYTAFMYTKMNNKIYAPLALTNFSYSENYENYTNVKVNLSFKEVNLLEFKTDENGVTTTNVYVPDGITQNRELTPLNLNDSMQERYSKDTRTSDLK